MALIPVNGYIGENKKEKFAEFSVYIAWLELCLIFFATKVAHMVKTNGKYQKSHISRKIVK